MFQIGAAHEYHLDDLGRICPVHQMGWVRERWQDAPSFDEAMEGIAAVVMTDVFPNGDRGLTRGELGDLQAKRYLDIADGFYLATAIDGSLAVCRFIWQDEIFFTIRPDFFFRSLVSDLSEPPINILESAIRDRLLDYYRERVAVKNALARGEIEVAGVYPMEWWGEFWSVRGISSVTKNPSVSATSEEKPLITTERNSLLTIIAALCDYSGIDPAQRGAAPQIARLTQELGATVSEQTVRDMLKKIPFALEARMR